MYDEITRKHVNYSYILVFKATKWLFLTYLVRYFQEEIKNIKNINALILKHISIEID